MRHLTFPINVAYFKVSIYRLHAKQRPTFYTGTNFKHIFSSLASKFVCSVMSTLSERIESNVYRTKVSEIVSDIFTYIMFQWSHDVVLRRYSTIYMN